MNTNDTATNDTATNDTDNKTKRPGFWLRAIEYRKHQLGREERRAFRDSLADKARDGISDEDYATTMATLEKMARNLGWDDEQEIPRHGRGPFGRGHGPRGFGGHGHPFAREFGPGFGYDPAHHGGPKDLPTDEPKA